MTKTDAWMPLWIGAYLADTLHLARDEHGGYLLLIMAYWRTRSPLPDDNKHLAAIVKATPKEWKSLRPILAGFFQIENGVWRHKRIDQELEDAGQKKAKATSKAQAAAQARWKDAPRNAPSINQSDAPSIPQALHKECPTPSPIKPTSQPVNAHDPEKFAMRIGWEPSAHVADLARQSGAPLADGDLPEFMAHWLTEPTTKRTQAEWDKALLQCAKHRKLRAASPLPSTVKQPRKTEDFSKKDYGTEIRPL